MQIELEGEAILGLGEHFASTELSQLPTTVCLGRVRPRALSPALSLAPYIDEVSTLRANLPASINRRDRAATSLKRMYMNDRYGCCVWSGKAHQFGLWSANDSDSGGEVEATDEEIKRQYFNHTGGRDVGCSISAVLDEIRSRGMVLGGKTYKIDGYVRVDWTSKEQTQAAQYIFAGNSIGFNLPDEWRKKNVWEPTNSRIVGGHDVTPVDYDDDGVYVSSWGRIYLMTWAAWQSRKWIEEYYAVLAPLWYGNDQVNSVTGFDVRSMRGDLQKLGGGVLPDIIPPVPPDGGVQPGAVRIHKAIRGRVGDVEFGSEVQPGDYDLVLRGEGGPPPVPE